MPVASSVGVYHEFGGGRKHPQNYDFASGLTGWNSVGGFVAAIDNRKIEEYTIGATGGAEYTPIYGDATDKNYLVNRNEYSRNENPIYIESDGISIPHEGGGGLNVNLIVNAIGPATYPVFASAFLRVAVVAVSASKTLTLGYNGNFIEMPSTNPPVFVREFERSNSLSNIPISSLNININGLLEVENFADYKIKIRIYGGGGGRTIIINYASVTLSSSNETPKGNIYKTTQGDNFTKVHDTDTTVIGDYRTSGLNGYGYPYPIDDTSSLLTSTGLLTERWTAPDNADELPILQHVTRQRAKMFSIAHDLLTAEIDSDVLDPLATFRDCSGKKYVMVSGSHDFLRGTINVEIEEIAYSTTIWKQDYIYSYFGEGEEGISSVGGISESAPSAGGGGMTPEQLEILNNLSSWWKYDDVNDAIYSEKSVYSLKEVSAYGVGSGTGGGSSYNRLDAWADYSADKSGWVLSALLGVDLNNRLSNVESGSATSVNVTGTGDVIVGGSKSGNVITLTRGNQSWDNLSGKPTTFTPSAHTHSASDVASGVFNIARIPTGTSGSTVALGNHLHTGVYEPVFTKNTAFNKNFGTTAGTVAQGNDSRIINGQTAFGWGNHASVGYALASSLVAYVPYTGATQMVNLANNNILFSTGIIENNKNGLRLGNRVFQGNYPTSHTGIRSLVIPSRGERTVFNVAINIYGHSSKYQGRFVFGFYRQSLTTINTTVGNIGYFTGTTNFPFKDIHAGIDSNGDVRINMGNPSTNWGGYVSIDVEKSETFYSNYNENWGDGWTIEHIVGEPSGFQSIVKIPISEGIVGNASTATTLQTARTINGTSFDGSANITTANWGTARNIGIVNSDGTGTAVTTSVNGSANVNLKLPATIKASLTGNASSATKLQTARTIAGVSFDGTADIAIPFANLSSKPTTLSGYGITDGVTTNTTQTVTGAKTFSALLTASAGVNTPKVDFGNGFTVEPSGTELVFKYNGVIKQRMLSDGSIVATGELTAYVAAT